MDYLFLDAYNVLVFMLVGKGSEREKADHWQA